ncbi:hypothetical protein SAURM35S_08129 [Streptomyces aurantiogriseus]
MAGWWKALGLRALLEANAETLAAVWPAVRDGTAPPAPEPARTRSLAALSRAASKAAAGGGDDAPELAVALLVGAVLHRAFPTAVSPALLPLVAPSADVDAQAAAVAGRAFGGFAGRSGSDRTPPWLRRWCLDAALLCGSRCLHGPAPSDTARGKVHDLLALLAGQRFKAGGDPADEDVALTHARAALDLATGPERPDRAARLAQLLTSRSLRLRDPSLLENAVELARSALAPLDPESFAWQARAALTVSALLAATAQDTKDVELLDEALDLERAIRRHPQYHRVQDGYLGPHAGLLAQRFARRRDPGILDEAIAAYEELYALEPGRYAADLGRHLQYRYQMHGDTADRHRALDLMAEGLSAAPADQEAIMSYGTAVLQEHRESGDPEAVERALATVTRYRVVSSYTPSVAALLRARSGTAAGAHPLIVAVPELDGQAPLPGALREADLAHAAVGGTLLTGDAARADTVRTALAAHSWAHFACHGVQDPEQPSRGRLLLPDGELSVLDISRLHLPGAQFAYLSACETAVGGTRLPDEALHLAGTLQLAGFSQVIGTLWRVDDESSAEIAQGVYGLLKDTGTGAPPAALALHQAVGRLRARHPDRPLSWAAHMHSGA